MAAIYRKYLDSFIGAGIVRTQLGTARSDWLPFMHFSSVGAATKYGSWGMLEWAFQDYAAPVSGAPKAVALQVGAFDDGGGSSLPPTSFPPSPAALHRRRRRAAHARRLHAAGRPQLRPHCDLQVRAS